MIVSGDKHDLLNYKKRVWAWQKAMSVDSLRCEHDEKPLSPVIASDRLYLVCKHCGYELHDIPDEILQEGALNEFRETWSIKNPKTIGFIIFMIFISLELIAHMITLSNRH